jgi:glycosyltransferase involved in cell wall biosynthesis
MAEEGMNLPRVNFVVESGTDVRLVEGLAERFVLTVLARRILGGVEINWPSRLPLALTPGAASRFGFAMQVGRHLWRERQRTDFVVVQGYGLAALAANLAARLTGTPTAMLICSPVETYYLCRRSHPEPGKPFRRCELWGLRALARLNGLLGRQYWVLSEHLAQMARAHSSRKPINIVPVYGVDTRIFRPPSESKATLRARLGLPTTGALLFFSSRIAPEKDAETLLVAVRQLLDAGRDIWLLHRSGGHRSFLEDARRFGIAERVIVGDATHPHHQLPQYYQACDLCVQASRAEGLGFSPLEALACGVPVVATAVGGLRETIMDGRTGWTYPAGDAEELAKCIAAVLDDPVEAARRASAGRQMVRACFEREFAFTQLAHAIHSALSTKTAEPDSDYAEVL